MSDSDSLPPRALVVPLLPPADAVLRSRATAFYREHGRLPDWAPPAPTRQAPEALPKVRKPRIKCVKIPEDRASLALEASWEIEPILDMLLDELETIRAGGEASAEVLALRGIALRVQSLNSVIMSVLGGDDLLETEEMRRVLVGRRGAQRAKLLGQAS